MMAGPQMMSAIIFVTSPKLKKTSLGFLLGIVLATSAGVLIMLGVASLLGSNVALGSSEGVPGSYAGAALMNNNAWAVNVGVCLIFVTLILG